jgi:hypothetical protein
MSVELINYNDTQVLPKEATEAVHVPYAYIAPEDYPEYRVPYNCVTSVNLGVPQGVINASTLLKLQLMATATSCALASSPIEKSKPKDGWYRQHGKRWER